VDINLFFEELSATFEGGTIDAICALIEKNLAAAKAEGDSNAQITILNEKVGFYRSISRYGEAIQAAEEALALMISLGHANSVPHGTTLLNAGTAYRAAGKITSALDCFIKAQSIFEARLETNDHRLAGLYNNMSAAYQEEDRHEEALVMLEKAAKIMGNSGEVDSKAVVVLSNLAVAQLRQGKEAEALATLEQVHNIVLVKPSSGKTPEFAIAFAGMGEAFYRMGQYEKSVEVFEKALALVQEAFGENKDYATLCFNCANAHDKLEQTDIASSYIKKGKDTLERLGLSI
jgi:Tetratricopeptide repeat.